MEPLFKVENECIRYDGCTALDRVSFSIHEGERVCFVGESGAGKSTILRMLYERRRSEIGLIPQNMGLVGPLTVFHNIYMGRLNRNTTLYNLRNLIRPVRREVAVVERVAERLGLTDKLFEQVEKLSGGQKQRTAVGRAIHQQSRIIIADEPVSAVDEFQSRAVLEYINQSAGAVLTAMHNVNLALEYSDRVIGLLKGSIVIDQPTKDLVPSDLDHLYSNN